MIRAVHCILLLLCLPYWSTAQLRPGFDKEEYRKLMYLSAHTTADTGYSNKFPTPEGYRLLYQSKPVGLDNLWELWMQPATRTAIISLRGTTRNQVSWLANFYSAMVPAQGSLQLAQQEMFPYTLSTDPRAAVHIGWLVSTAFLSKEIVPKLDSLHRQGIRDVLIIGHSQGGAIAYLITAYLHHLQSANRFGGDIRFKTYCSAAPKPGNLYFAYEYESITKGGWSFNVVNDADWVPETPVSIQTLRDFNKINPFTNARKLLRKQPFPQNVGLSYLFNRLNNPIIRAQRNYTRYLGKGLEKQVKKSLSGYQPSQYVASNHYVRTGSTIVLRPDTAYYNRFPDKQEDVFVHHLHLPYLFLLEKY